jgi:hypothetical protein
LVLNTLTRQEVLGILQGDWAEYVQRFRCLSAEAQSAFLLEQGYARFADLLAHLVAWWEVGHQAIERYVTDPAAQPGKYDVDAFNADAVVKAAGLHEEDVIASFEKMRNFLVEFVKALPDTAFENEKVVNQLSMELVGHFSEHRISKSDRAM